VVRWEPGPLERDADEPTTPPDAVDEPAAPPDPVDEPSPQRPA